jgi:hypothetical protein
MALYSIGHRVEGKRWVDSFSFFEWDALASPINRSPRIIR